MAHRVDVAADEFGEFGAVAVTTGDAVVVAGSMHRPGGVEALAAVRSGDRWAQHSLGEGAVSAVAARDGEFLVGGAHSSGRAAVWTSTDGTAWRLEEFPQAREAARSWVAALAVGGCGWGRGRGRGRCRASRR